MRKNGLHNRFTSQSAMEYLMTYGWAILIIAVILGVLFQLGVFSGGNLGNSCLAASGFLCQKYTMDTAGALNFTLGYVGQGLLNITAIGCSSTSSFNASSLSSSGVTVSPLRSGQTETMTAQCNLNGRSNIGVPFSGTLWVQYNQGSRIGLVSQVAKVVTSASTFASYSTTATTLAVTGLSNPFDVAYDPSNGYMYVTNWNGGGTLSIISGVSTTPIATITVGAWSQGVAYNPNNGYMYVANSNGNTVNVISGTTVLVPALTVGTNPVGIAYNPSNGYMYATNSGDGTVSVISGISTTPVATITVGSSPRGVAYNPGNGYMYVTNYGGTTVSVISGISTTLVTTITVGANPLGVAYNPSNGYMYVVNSGDGTVSVISGISTTPIATITVGSYPRQVAYDPSNGYMYVAKTDGTVSIISGISTTPVATITAGTNPWGVAYNPSNGYMYVANSNGATMSVV